MAQPFDKLPTQLWPITNFNAGNPRGLPCKIRPYKLTLVEKFTDIYRVVQ